jgi:hypothetical protein
MNDSFKNQPCKIIRFSLPWPAGQAGPSPLYLAGQARPRSLPGSSKPHRQLPPKLPFGFGSFFTNSVQHLARAQQ